MLTADQIEALGSAAEQLMDPLVRWLIADIGKRVSQAGQFTSTAQYEIWRLQNLGLSQKEIKERIAKMLNISEKEAEELLKQSAEVGYNFDISRLPTSRAIPFAENEVIQQIVSAAVSMAGEGLENLTQTMGFVTVDGQWSPLTEAYRKSCDFAFMQTITGTTSYTQAIRDAVRGLRKSGISCIDYESGRHYTVEAAVRRNVFSAMGIMQEKISHNVHDSTGCDGWEISAHAASAPDHEPIQGKQYSDEEYERLNNSLVRRIGTLNCGHGAYPIVLGISKPMYTEKQLEQLRAANEKGFEYEGKHFTQYEATQRQRRLERAIRKNRENILLDEAVADQEQLQADQIREVRLEEEYKRFSEEAGLKLKHERMEMAGYGPKQAVAAEKTAKNEIEKGLDNSATEDGENIALEQTIKITKKSSGQIYSSVNRELVNSKAYHDKFEDITSHKPVNEAIYQESMRMLEHRDGTPFEDMVLLDSRTGEYVTGNMDSSAVGKTGLTDEQYAAVLSHSGNMIIVHNHPNSSRISYKDILTMTKNPSISAVIAVGHDGSVYCVYDLDRNFDIENFWEEAYNGYKEVFPDEKLAEHKATDDLYALGIFKTEKR